MSGTIGKRVVRDVATGVSPRVEPVLVNPYRRVITTAYIPRTPKVRDRVVTRTAEMIDYMRRGVKPPGKPYRKPSKNTEIHVQSGSVHMAVHRTKVATYEELPGGRKRIWVSVGNWPTRLTAGRIEAFLHGAGLTALQVSGNGEESKIHEIGVGVICEIPGHHYPDQAGALITCAPGTNRIESVKHVVTGEPGDWRTHRA